ncbi:MAG: hypothetical protein H7A20_03405 [Rhodanobacteraceae bacterium]|nr:hypothetical protein [Xanthomonadales bacterium]MCP5477830.1 hypothetical protein [Rhodanobacteraceae bacterium]HPF72739.1 hypothetical protein [Xanthomonadaceae bacterium]HRX99715.1 hypothetical protein [Xanthomonadaceae bacterium]
MPQGSRTTRLTAMALCLLLAACAGDGGKSSSNSPSVEPAAPGASAAEVAPAADPGIDHVDYHCESDEQCVIKDIGSCCGYRPACVNIDSPTDPAGVKAACERDGTMSICGFPAINACQCVANRCEGVSGSNAALPATGEK